MTSSVAVGGLWSLCGSFARARAAAFNQPGERWIAALIPTRKPPWAVVRVPFIHSEGGKMLGNLNEGEWRIVRALDRRPMPLATLARLLGTTVDDAHAMAEELRLRGLVTTGVLGVSLTENAAGTLGWLPA